jgi:hypothetical protein
MRHLSWERRIKASLTSLIANLQDPEAGTVTTSTGDVYTADVIIGKPSGHSLGGPFLTCGVKAELDYGSLWHT